MDKTQTHALTLPTWKAAQAYFNQDAPKSGNVWRASASKGNGKQAKGTLTKQGMTDRGLTVRARLPALLGNSGGT